MRTNEQKWRKFEDARSYVRQLKLKKIDEWFLCCEGEIAAGPLPPDIPELPDLVYKGKGWVSWKNWLGLGIQRKRDWLPFKKARTFARKLQLKSQKDWFKYVKGDLPAKREKPENIPACPNITYKKEWISWGDFLGNRGS